jgi:hypothetical protein
MPLQQLQGGGHEIEGEVQRMRDGIAVGIPNKLGKKFGNFRPYLYARPDAVRPAFAAKHSKTSHELKEMMLCDFKNYIETGLMKVRSKELLAECALFIRKNDGDIVSVGVGSHSKMNDDRVMAAALALQVYLRPILWYIGGTKFTRQRKTTETEVLSGKTTVEDLINQRVLAWYQRQGGKPKR